MADEAVLKEIARFVHDSLVATEKKFHDDLTIIEALVSKRRLVYRRTRAQTLTNTAKLKAGMRSSPFIVVYGRRDDAEAMAKAIGEGSKASYMTQTDSYHVSKDCVALAHIIRVNNMDYVLSVEADGLLYEHPVQSKVYALTVYNDPFRYAEYAELMADDQDLPTTVGGGGRRPLAKQKGGQETAIPTDHSRAVRCGKYAANKLLGISLHTTVDEYVAQSAAAVEHFIGDYEVKEYALRIGAVDFVRVTVSQKDGKRVCNYLLTGNLAPTYVVVDDEKVSAPPLTLLCLYIELWLTMLRRRREAKEGKRTTDFLLKQLTADIVAVESAMRVRIESRPSWFLAHDGALGKFVNQERASMIDMWNKTDKKRQFRLHYQSRRQAIDTSTKAI